MVRFLEALLHHLGLLLSHTPQESPMTSRSALCLYHCLSTLHPWTVHFTYYPKTEDRHSLKYLTFITRRTTSTALICKVLFTSCQLSSIEQDCKFIGTFVNRVISFSKLKSWQHLMLWAAACNYDCDEPSTKLCRRTNIFILRYGLLTTQTELWSTVASITHTCLRPMPLCCQFATENPLPQK